jgi:hypothetical protein
LHPLAKICVCGCCLLFAAVVVPVYVNWLRHRPHRLTESTQHIWWAGVLVQWVLIVSAGLVLWLL